jgi:hypothetical protein
VQHGFIALTVPEPGSLALLATSGLVLIGRGASRIRRRVPGR